MKMVKIRLRQRNIGRKKMIERHGGLFRRGKRFFALTM